MPLPGGEEYREETDDLFRPNGVEAEDIGENTALVQPYDPELIRVDPKTYSLRQILDMIDEKDLDLAPDFQRLKVWNIRQKSRLIESILLRIPLPAFYFSSDKDGKLQVVDGLQRLSTIHDFVRGGRGGSSVFALEGLEYLNDQVGGRLSAEFKDTIWMRRINQTQIIANVIDPQTPYRVKFDIFRRINTGGTPLNAQEIRHCLSLPQSRQFLMELISAPEFYKATDGALAGNVRMVDREVVLRFCAFRKYPGLDQYPGFPTMDEFLNEASSWLDHAPDYDLEALRKDFFTALENAWALFEIDAFRKPRSKSGNRPPFNRALFEVWTVLLSDYSESCLLGAQNSIRSRLVELFETNPQFVSSVSTATGNPSRVSTRFNCIREILPSKA